MNHKCSFDELSEIFLEGIFPNAQMLVYTKRVSFCFLFFRTNSIDLVLAAIATTFLGSGKEPCMARSLRATKTGAND